MYGKPEIHSGGDEVGYVLPVKYVYVKSSLKFHNDPLK